MTGARWSAEALRAIETADELEIATTGRDGRPRPWIPIWAVRVGDDVAVRTWQRRTTGWYGAAVATGRARIRLPGLEAAVRVVDVGVDDARAAVDAAYRAKYGRYGAATTGRMVGDDAAATTLRLEPAED